MLAALLYGQEDLRLEQVAEPTPAAGEVVIQVAAATTCGTDLKVWRRGNHAKMLHLPTLFGHEASGRIVAVGEGTENWQVGDRVVANNSAPCMKCFFCQREEYSLCPNLTWNNGTFAEYLKIPAAIVQHNMLRIPAELSHELAAMTEPLACVLHGIARSDVRQHDTVVVLGDGAIGLMFVAVLAQQGNCVLLFGGNQQRLQIGQKLGAAKTFNYRKVEDTPSVVKEYTAGWGADVVIEATGVPTVWESAIACARPGGTVNLFGGCPRDTTITVNTEQLHYSELTLKGVFHNTPKYVRAALSLLASRVIPFELLISEQRSLQDLEQVFQDMKARKVIKVAIA
ncbi:zinc-dependent alcohol dehydrogenase [Gloeocapsopsis dulcis]|uniref:Dehydrogenase n=1 Tax=Gloeocapsopsis dulcis AAB1 = 1H9 TaxID=1433147 RepID=A0A6N8FW98_9CHRO|nr:alcohol dehydrogenase catalytic domain-containing protein [Gloeocapsopsis dulcis]MUL36427.1 dehydrogenase [Gloeocapsopsis dulcis AAB1 = 1H9]WNN88077.1 alcohol dehydrogenase catalytic domain-containing protein [Gloeocapsopsis dulcis]